MLHRGMANQRRKDKKNVSIPMEDELREIVEKAAEGAGLDRTKFIKSVLRKDLGLPPEKLPPAHKGGSKGPKKKN